MNPRCRQAEVIWPAIVGGFFAAFGVAQYQALHTGCHPPMSHILYRWLRCDRKDWTRWVGPTLLSCSAAVLAAHVALLETEEKPCS